MVHPILGNLHSEMTDQRCDSGILYSGEALFFFHGIFISTSPSMSQSW